MKKRVSRRGAIAMATGLALSCCTTVLAQPANNTCGANMATFTIPGTGGVVSQTTAQTTGWTRDGAACTGSTGADVYWYFTPATAGPWQIDTCTAAAFDSVLSIHNNTCPVGTANYADGQAGTVACADDTCGSSSRINVSLTAGNTYIIRVGRFSGTAAGAYTLTVADVSTPGACCTAGACTLTTVVGCTSPSTFQGTGTVCSPNPCPQPPANDLCANATVFSGTGFTTTGNNNLATNDGWAAIAGGTFACDVGNTLVAPDSRADMWYQFTPSATNNYNLALCASTPSWDSVLSVHSACPVDPNSNTIACNDDGTCSGGVGLSAITALNLSGGVPVWIRVGRYGTTGTQNDNFILQVISDPLGACCNSDGTCALTTSAACTTGGGTYQGDATACGTVVCTGACCNIATGACTATSASGCVGGTFGGLGSTCAAAACAGQACCNPTTGACSFTGTDPCPSGTNPQGTGTVCTPNPCPPPPPPANDLCAAAIVIPSVGTPAVTGDNVAATTDGAATCQTSSNKDVWYTFTAPAAGSYQMDTEGSSQSDTVLNVFDACGGTELACDDDSGTGLLSVLLINLTSGQTVTIRLASFGATPAGGGFNININSVTTGACCNDLTGACTIVVGGVCASGSTYQGDNSVCTPSPCPASGSCCDPSSGLCLLRVQAQCASPNVWTSGAVCTPNPCPQPPPPSNDTCANAIVVNGTVTGGGNTVPAQNENDEPAGTCNATGAAGVDNSIWFTFNSSTGGQLTGTVDPTTYDAVGVLYTGSCGLATLTEVACWDIVEPFDLAVPETGSSLLTAGQNYYLVIGDWGVTDGGGATTWTITVPGGPANGRCCIGARCAIVTAANCTASGASGASFTPAVADCNATGTFNTPCCFADYNKVGGVTVQDIFDFLTDWFGGNVNANVGGDGVAGPSVQDIFDFLTAWFSGCA